MGRKTKTTIKFQVRMVLPTGANGKDAVEFLRDAIAVRLNSSNTTEPMNKLEHKDIAVSLLSKETTYA